MDFLPFENLENHEPKFGKVKVSRWIHGIDTGV
jgi:hypothetical protein